MSSHRSGAGHPARTLELLWQAPPPPRGSRGPAPGLSVELVVRRATALADAAGLESLTMRRLAADLGVSAMTLYTYVPGRAELLDLMLDRVFGALDPGEPAADWRTGVAAVARRSQGMYAAHPWMAEVSTGRPPLGPGLMAKYEHELQAFEELGLDDVQTDAALTFVLDFVRSAALAAQEAERQAQSGSDEQWWRAHEPLLARVLDPNRYPTAVRVGAAAGAVQHAAYSPVHAYDFGLARVLDGLAVLVAAKMDG